MSATYDAEIDFLQDQISVLSDEIAERDKHIESLKSERVAGGYEAAGPTGRGGSRASSMAPSDDGGADRDVELQVQALLHSFIHSFSLSFIHGAHAHKMCLILLHHKLTLSSVA